MIGGRIRSLRRSMIIVLSLLMIFSSLISGMAMIHTTKDIEGHWAQEIIREWLDKGLVRGYPDGSFRPNHYITRGELMTLINKSFNYSESIDINYTDVSKDAWYYDAIAIATAAGYIGGYPDGSMRPNNPISRQETAVILTKIMDLALSPNGVTRFNDDVDIPSWSRGYIGAVVEAGYMRGYPDGNFKPNTPITRAEALVVLNKAQLEKVDSRKEEVFTGKIVETGHYGPAIGVDTFEGDVWVKAEGATLQNMIIKGDLIIGEEVGQGEVYLNNITVEGDTYLRGGGRDSIYINGGSYRRIIIQKSGNGIRVVAIGARVPTLIVYEESNNNEVILEGSFDRVTIMAKGITLITKEETTIENLTISREAQDTLVMTSEKTLIREAMVDSNTEFKNEGRIIRAAGIYARLARFDVKQPENFTVPPVTGGGGVGPSTPALRQVEAIIATPTSGIVTMGTMVTLSTATEGATIYYTLDGSNPTNSSIQYTGPITINSATTIKAIGVKSGMNNSSVRTFSYTVEAPLIPSMTVSPAQVIVNSNFNKIFILTISNDTVVNTVYAESLALDGALNGMTVGAVARTSDTTVTAAVYGNLSNSGIGTITLQANALISSQSNLIGNVTVLEASAVPVSDITVNPTTANLVVGGKQQLIATVIPNNATNKEVTWSSSDEAVATVDGNGLVTGVTVGTANITVTTVDGSFTDIVTISVTAAVINVSAITITGDARVGIQLTTTVTPSGATVNYQWQRANTEDGTYTNISGATSATYIPTGDDVDMYLKVSATGTGSYTGTVTSDAVGPVTAAVLNELLEGTGDFDIFVPLVLLKQMR